MPRRVPQALQRVKLHRHQRERLPDRMIHQITADATPLASATFQPHCIGVANPSRRRSIFGLPYPSTVSVIRAVMIRKN